MDEGEPIHESLMRSAEIKALFYELPLFIMAVLGAAALAYLYKELVMRFDPMLETRMPAYLMAALVGIVLIWVFWAASFYPRKVVVYEDEILFDMLFGRRTLRAEDLKGVREFSEMETKKTFFRPGYANLTPAVSGALAVEKSKGRVWVLSPEDPAALAGAIESVLKNQERASNRTAPPPG